jgi:hypothetical protein
MHLDIGYIRCLINVIDPNKLERDAQISSRNLRKLDCAGKPVPTFPQPALVIFMTREIGKSSRGGLNFFLESHRNGGFLARTDYRGGALD